MQVIMEVSFDVIYLISVIMIGLYIIKKSDNLSVYKLFGFMAIVLGFGDAFHLVPRAYALLTTGLENHVIALGIGKWITSVTMTVFYVLLYLFWQKKYNKNDKKMTLTIYILAIIRIVLCMMPQNQWLTIEGNLLWALIRNIPFAIMGLIILILFLVETIKNNDQHFKYMPLAITLSFGFYMPVVIWSKSVPWVGVLMIPKTLAYVWIVLMGLMDLKDKIKV